MTNLGFGFLFAANPVFGVLAIGGDLVVFLGMKVVRGDLRYWFKFDGAASWIVSVITRIITKIITDFTGLAHLRHPYELGGYYVISLVLAPLKCILGAYLYISGGIGSMNPTVVWSSIAIPGVVWILSFCCFFWLMYAI